MGLTAGRRPRADCRTDVIDDPQGPDIIDVPGYINTVNTAVTVDIGKLHRRRLTGQFERRGKR